MQHTIYILDHPSYASQNINFLNYIKYYQNVIKNMDVRIKISVLLPTDLNNPEISSILKLKNIDIFPTLVTDTKIYKGMEEIVNIYTTNIKEYNNYLKQVEEQKAKFNEMNNKRTEEKKIEEKRRKENEDNIDDEDQIHSYMNKQLQMKSKYDDDEEDTALGDSGDNSMMDTYRHMIARRDSTKKNPLNSKMRTLESNDTTTNNNTNNTKLISNNDIESMQSAMYKQLQKNNMSLSTHHDTIANSMDTYNKNNNNDNNDNSDNEEREDNIKGGLDDEGINIDPTKLSYDGEEDPQDAIIEKAYWSRMAETK